jgi:hypothetical protein
LETEGFQTFLHGHRGKPRGKRYAYFITKITGIKPQGKPWTQSLRGKPRGIEPDFTGTALGSERRLSLRSLRLVIKKIFFVSLYS